MHREGRFDILVTRLDDGEAALLKALETGRALGELPSVDRKDAVENLFRMIGRGWITVEA